VSNNDDWGDGSGGDWGSGDPESNFEQVSPPKSSFLGTVANSALWIKVVAGVAAVAVSSFVFVQAGGVGRLQGMGLFRQQLSPAAMCLNGGQVVTEMSVGTINALLMNKAIEHADRLKTQSSGVATVDEAVWAIADTAYEVRDAVESLPSVLSSPDAMLGEYFEALNSDEVKRVYESFTQASAKLASACESAVNSELSSEELTNAVTALEPNANPVESPKQESSELPAIEPDSVVVIEVANEPNEPSETMSADVVDGLPISFLTFNVCKSDCKDPAPSWQIRRDRIARVINEADVSIVGLQEVTNWDVSGTVSQWQDLQDLLEPTGFVSPVVDSQFNECPRKGENVCANTARILYQEQDLTQLNTLDGQPAAGYSTLGDISSGIDVNARDRSVAWSYLETTTGQDLLVISLHMDEDKSTPGEDSRVAIASGLKSWSSELDQRVGLQPKTVVLLADLNSYAARQPSGAQAVLRSEGWQDAFGADTVVNSNFSTVNYTPDTISYGGWPPRPRPYNRDATRIDYIFALGNVQFLDYEVMIWVNPDGTFDEDYQASDHQSVRATLRI
jgi:endonuclease/exonuclease/phosphatase family metal-dependent hydrolase